MGAGGSSRERKHTFDDRWEGGSYTKGATALKSRPEVKPGGLMQSSQGLFATVGVLASDLDGTLLTPDHEPGDGTVEAIAAFQEAGGIFCICTGRDRGSARTVLKGIDIEKHPGVYMNGTIVQGPDGEIIKSATLPPEVVKALVDWGSKNRDLASILLVDCDTHYVMDTSEEWALYMHKHLLDPMPLQVEGGWDSAEPKIPANVSLMRVICSPENMPTVKPQIKALIYGQAQAAQSLTTTIDIMALNTTKATGLHVLLQAIGKSEAVTAAVGDSENDLEMLQSVRVACAMGNAVQKTKTSAHFVLPTNSDKPGGVVYLLNSITSALKTLGPQLDSSPTNKPPEGVIRVACFGGGSWGTPVARMVAQSALSDSQFHNEVKLWINDEIFQGKRLSEQINDTRENPKYMPGYRVPVNIRACEDAKEVARDADILIFVERHDVLRMLLKEIAGTVKPTAMALVMSKDLLEIGDNTLKFGSQVVSEQLGIPVAVLMGGTLAGDVAAGSFAEATLGCEDPEKTKMLLSLFNKPNFSVSSLDSPNAVELFAVLKTMVSVAGGVCDGIGYGFNTKSAIVRLGAVEISKFAVRFFPQQASAAALHEACGWTDLIVSSFGNSRNRLWAEAFAKDTAKSWEAVAVDCLSDPRLPTGIRIIQDVFTFVRKEHVEMDFPFISKLYRIIMRLDPPESLTAMTLPRVRRSDASKVAVLGSGNWGTAIARIVGNNVGLMPDFQKTVSMWVHEEMVDGRKLTEIINTDHENVKYLPGFELPANIVAVPDPVEAVTGANILVFVLPHQFLDSLLDKIAPVVTPGTIAVSLVKGHIVVEDGGKVLKTGSQVIAERLKIPECAVLNGANVAKDVATGNFAEATLGCSREEDCVLLWRLFNCRSFSVRSTTDVFGVELFGGLKNVVALAAGFCDGLGLAANTKAAVLRRGLLEMSLLIGALFPTSRPETVEESCGIADLLTTCYSGRNRLCAEAFARDPSRTWEEIEADMLKGQKLQGPSCCMDVQALIDHRNLRDKLPLLTAIHGAVTKKISPMDVFTTNGFLAGGAEQLRS
mmetsp:Transcript_34620/g.98533  ORF Transcript_34620/g.98533 Transcript_34620/m.98533 type:complete len:1052 (+) Transcript_34620:79-3234(+)